MVVKCTSCSTVQLPERMMFTGTVSLSAYRTQEWSNACLPPQHTCLNARCLQGLWSSSASQCACVVICSCLLTYAHCTLRECTPLEIPPLAWSSCPLTPKPPPAKAKKARRIL
eukprot:745406-Pelagomonas_calceolata.AAC.2